MWVWGVSSPKVSIKGQAEQALQRPRQQLCVQGRAHFPLQGDGGALHSTPGRWAVTVRMMTISRSFRIKSKAFVFEGLAEGWEYK